MVESVALIALIFHDFLHFWGVFPNFGKIERAKVLKKFLILQILLLGNPYRVDIKVKSFRNILWRAVTDH